MTHYWLLTPNILQLHLKQTTLYWRIVDGSEAKAAIIDKIIVHPLENAAASNTSATRTLTAAPAESTRTASQLPLPPLIGLVTAVITLLL